MTQEIIAMACDAFNCAFTNLPAQQWKFERFARIVRNQALEDAAQACMSRHVNGNYKFDTREDCSDAIRNMKDKP